MPATTTHGLPYPLPADPPNGASAIRALAEATDSAVAAADAVGDAAAALVVTRLGTIKVHVGEGVYTAVADQFVEIQTGFSTYVTYFSAMSSDQYYFDGYVAVAQPGTGGIMRCLVRREDGAPVNLGAAIHLRWIALAT